MLSRKFKLVSVFILVIFLAFGCTSVNYVGKSLDPTQSIEMYFSEDDIKKEYTVIGHALGLGVIVGIEKVEAKLIEEARLRGADAILITGLGKSDVLITAGSSIVENQIYTLFLKYK